jgi:hypothetical protein
MALTTITFCEIDETILLGKAVFSELVKFYLENHPSERITIEDSANFRADIALLLIRPAGCA